MPVPTPHTPVPRVPRQRLPVAEDRGSMSVFYIVAALCVFVVIGLVADGGGALNAAARADDVAQEAARAGGQQIDAGRAIPGNKVAVNPEAAVTAARSYLDAEGLSGEVSVDEDATTLHVTVHDTYDTNFSKLVGYSRIQVTGEGRAHLIHQIDEGD